MNLSAVIVMAGKGERMKANENKVLLYIGKKRLFEYPMYLFLKNHFEVILVVSEADYDLVKTIVPRDVKVVLGGASRQESVYNGLKAATGEYVFIHDAARSFLSQDVIDRLMANLHPEEAMCVYQEVKDTIRLNNYEGCTTLKRDELIAAQTPQCAALSLLLSVHEKAQMKNHKATDDIALIEEYEPNVRVKYILGNDANFKITTPLDYELAKIVGERYND